MSISDFYRGDTQTYKITIRDKVTGTPVDITGSTFWFTLKEFPDLPDSEASIQKSVTNHADPTNGVTIITLTPADTGSLSPNTRYYYDFQWVTNTGDVHTIIAGKVKVLQDITRSS